jgi:hypothetical protein
MCSDIICSTSGKVTSAINAGSYPCFCAASVNAGPVRLGFFASQFVTSRISCGFVEAVVICASSASG